MRREVVIVPTGTANTASVVAALGRSGASTRVAADATEVELADNVVLPGVGSFGSAMSRIDELGMRTVLMQRVEAGRPTLAICLGMQLLCAGSAESPAARGLGVVPGTVGRFTGEVLVPQLGWNRVVPGHETRFLTPGWAYFANSYRLSRTPEGWAAATSEYGGRFVAALERGSVLACQFHPELSGIWGAQVLERWMTLASGVV